MRACAVGHLPVSPELGSEGGGIPGWGGKEEHASGGHARGEVDESEKSAVPGVGAERPTC